jgi:hypothetical protein
MLTRWWLFPLSRLCPVPPLPRASAAHMLSPYLPVVSNMGMGLHTLVELTCQESRSAQPVRAYRRHPDTNLPAP